MEMLNQKIEQYNKQLEDLTASIEEQTEKVRTIMNHAKAEQDSLKALLDKQALLQQIQEDLLMLSMHKPVAGRPTRLKVKARIRFWQDSILNEQADKYGNMPCREGDYWMPIIDLATGKIENWEVGNIADISYKVVDEGVYTLLDKDGNIVAQKDGYVPEIMSPSEEGYGDYIYMDIEKDGQIKGWKGDLLREFQP